MYYRNNTAVYSREHARKAVRSFRNVTRKIESEHPPPGTKTTTTIVTTTEPL